MSLRKKARRSASPDEFNQYYTAQTATTTTTATTANITTNLLYHLYIYSRSYSFEQSDRTSQSTYHPDSLPHVYCEDRELLSRNRSLNSEGFEIEFRPALVIVAMEPGRNTGEARTPTLAERARKTVTRTRGFVHDSRQNVASGARTVGHNIRMAVGRAAERMVDNLHVLFPGLIRHPVGSYLKRAYGEFTVLELRDGVPYRNITAQSESRKIVTSFLRSLRLSYRFIPDVQGEPWYLDVADNINRLVAEAGESTIFGVNYVPS